MSVLKHKVEAPKQIHYGVITVSDTRTAETDKSGSLMKNLLNCNGHILCGYQIVKDERQQISNAIELMVEKKEIKAILINGGTGIAKRDVTIETVTSLFEKEMTGFGEIFRFLSYKEDIGSAAILSRATAGIYKKRVIFVTPGSTGAVKLAMEKLILPELGHIIHEIEKDGQ